MQTKFEETRIVTSDLKAMHGMYLTNHLLRTWKEDFIDQDTGEVVSIDRTEIILERGTLLDREKLATVNYHMLAGDFTEVEVSSQCRSGVHAQRGEVMSMKVLALVGRKKQSYILAAQSVQQAIAIATDYLELSSGGPFELLGIKALKSFVDISNFRLRKLNDDEAEITKDLDDDDTLDGQSIDKHYYEVEAAATIDDLAGIRDYELMFLCLTKDVDEAREIISLFYHNLMKDQPQTQITQVRILSAKPFKCSGVIAEEFCNAYINATN